MELAPSLSHTFSGFPVHSAADGLFIAFFMLLPLAFSCAPHSYLARFSKLPCTYTFSCLCPCCFLNMKYTFYLSFPCHLWNANHLSKPSSNMVVFFECVCVCFIQGKLSWYAQDSLFLLLHSHSSMLTTYLPANTWNVGISPYLHAAPLKKIEATTSFLFLALYLLEHITEGVLGNTHTHTHIWLFNERLNTWIKE